MTGGPTFYRSSPLALRAVDPEAREASLVALTQAPVKTRNGIEVVLLRGLDLARYRSNPVILADGDCSTVEAVLGSARAVEVQGDALVVRMAFARTPRADLALRLVRAGHLRGVSCAFLPLEVRRVPAGSRDVEANVAGPATIIVRSELLMVSLVAVPADPATLVRARAHGALAGAAGAPVGAVLPTDPVLLSSLRRIF